MQFEEEEEEEKKVNVICGRDSSIDS